MKLTDYEPRISDCYGVRCYLSFRCPHAHGCEAWIAIPFDPPLDGKTLPPELKGKTWSRTGGDDFESMTLAPSILLHATEHDGHPGWHGFLRNGNLETC